MSVTSNKKQRTIGFVMSYVFIAINSLIGFVLNPIMLKYMGDVDFGVYQTVATFSNYLLIVNFGIGTVVTRYVSFYVAQGDEKGKRNFLFLSSLITFCFCLIIVAIGLVLYFNIAHIYGKTLDVNQIADVQKIFPIMLLNIVVNVMAQSVQGIVLGYEKFIYNSVTNIIRIVVRLVVIIVALKLGVGGLGVAIAELATSVIYIVLLSVYVLFNLKVKIKFYFWDKALLAEIAVFALALLLQTFISQMNNLLGKFLLGVMSGPTDVTIYANVMTITTMFSSIATAAVSIFLPKATALVAKNANNNELTDFIIQPSRISIMLSGAILCGFLLFGRQFIALWIGEKYLSVWSISLIIMLPSFLFYSNGVIVSVLDAMKRKMARSLILLGTLVGNIVISICLIPKYGTYGTAIGSAVSMLIGQVIIMNIYYKKGVGLEIGQQFQKSFAGTVWCLLLATLICCPLAKYNAAPTIISFVFNVGCFLIVYLCCLLIIGFNKKEKGYIKGLIMQFKEKIFKSSGSKDISWQFLKGLCIFAVLLIHCRTGAEFSTTSWNYHYWIILRQFINYAVPVFFFAAAFFVNFEKVKKGYGGYLKKRLIQLIIPFFIWSTIYTVINIGFDLITRTPIDIKMTIFNWVTGRVGTPFYFVLVLVQFTLLLPLLVRLSENKVGRIGVFIVGTLWCAGSYVYMIVTKRTLIAYETICLTWLPIYFMGLLCKKYSWNGIGNRILRWLVVAVALLLEIAEAYGLRCLGVEIGGCVSQTRISSLIFSLAIINLFLGYREKLNNNRNLMVAVFLYLGNNSFAFFFIHCIFRKFSNFILPYVPYIGLILPIYQMLQLICMIMCSLIAILVIKKIFRKLSTMLFGV